MFLALNTGRSSPCWLPSVWFWSTSWFKDDAHGFLRLPSPSDFWVSIATGQLSAMSCFPGNTRVELRPSKFFVNPVIVISFSITAGKLLSPVSEVIYRAGVLGCSRAAECAGCSAACVAWDTHSYNTSLKLVMNCCTGFFSLHLASVNLPYPVYPRVLKKKGSDSVLN